MSGIISALNDSENLVREMSSEVRTISHLLHPPLLDEAGLCSALRWKGLFIDAERDATVPPCNDGLFWCMHTQTCIGPDGQLAEPGNCSNTVRKCHGTGKCG